MSKSISTRGRPPDPTVRVAILEAAFEVLHRRGYAGMAIEAVAEAAGAGKTTIYRWWTGRADLAVEAFYHATREDLRFPDTGTARGDFRAQIVELAATLRGPTGNVLAAMLAGGLTDPELAAALDARWLTPRQRWGVERMKRAAAEGECRDGLDIPAALGVLYGPLYSSLLFGRGFPSEAQVEAHLLVAFAGVFRPATSADAAD